MAEPLPKSKFEITVDLIKALIWPVIVIVLLIVFMGPLRLIAKQLPGLVQNSETITVAGLSIKIRKNDLITPPSDSVKTVISKLTADQIDKVLRSASESFWDKGNEHFGIEQMGDLVKLGLYEELSPAELRLRAHDGREYGYGTRPSHLGIETRQFLLQLIASFVSELKETER